MRRTVLANHILKTEIIERKQAQQRLVLIDFALNHVHEAAYLIDAQGNIVYANDQCCQILGLTRDELLSKAIDKMGHGFPLSNFRTIWSELVCSEYLTFEATFSNTNQHTLDLEVIAKYFVFEQNEYVLALARDITERKKNQRQLQLLNYALNHVSETIFLLGADSAKFLYANNTATESLGYSQEQWLNQLDLFAIDKHLTPAQWSEHWHHLQNDRRIIFESEYTTQTNQCFPVEVTACYFEYDNKPYSLCITRDISERKHVLSLLHNREQEFRTLIEHSPDIIARLNPALQYTYVNPALLNAFRLMPTEILQRHPLDVLPNHGFSQQFVQALTSVTEHKEEHSCELLVNPGHYSHPKTYLFRFVPEYNQTGDFESILAIGRDVSALKESERKLLTLTENIPDIVARLDQEGRYVYLNSAIEKVFGIPAQNYLGKTFGTTISQSAKPVTTEDVAHVKDLLTSVICTGTPISTEFVWRTAEQHYIFEFRFIPEFDALGITTSVLAIARDITERKHAEEEQRLTASVFANTSEGIVVTDKDMKILYINKAFSHITGFTSEELIGQTSDLFNIAPTLLSKINKSLKKKGHWSGEIWNQRKSGEQYPQRLTISTVYTEQGKIANYVSIVSDITELKKQEQQLETLAYYDALTGVANRVLLNEKMHEAIEDAQREGLYVAVAYFDLDAFKPVNDTFGHQSGDHILIQVTKRVSQELRAGDTLARLGGDEFVLLLPGLKKNTNFENLLTRLLEAISAPIWLDNQMVTLTASFGVTLYPTDDADPDTLLRHADQAMYQAKQLGKNRIQLYDTELDKQISHTLKQQDLIAHALQQTEFELYYQPKINLSTMRVVGAEALIRWHKPNHGVINPAEFLPLLEKSDLAVTLDHWVINNVLQQMACWQSDNLIMPISINLSARSLSFSNFNELLNKVLNDYPSVNPECLELEILENEALHDLTISSEVMRSCLALGVKFALDDFGTGYSSLSYLRHLPAQTLKIDQSFVRDMLHDEEDAAIVQGVIGLANAFKRDVIAEGVETKEHCQRLLNMGCTTAQGYFIAKPMPVSVFCDWLNHWHKEHRCL